MLFFHSNINIRFVETGDFPWTNYITAEALYTTKRLELINRRELAEKAWNENAKTFVIYVTSLLVKSTYPGRKVWIGLLLADDAPTKVALEYSDYTDVFSLYVAIGVLEHIDINNQAIKLEADDNRFIILSIV